MKLDLSDKADLQIAESVRKGLTDLPTEFPENVFELKHMSELEQLLEWGLIADEIVKLNFPVGEASKKIGGPKKVPAIKLKNKKKPIDSQSVDEVIEALSSTISAAGSISKSFETYVEVWKSKPLKPSNINLITSSTASKKNVLSLGQGGLKEPIDFQHYFRNEVFGNLNWHPVKPNGTDEADATFEVRIAGIFLGSFVLRVRFSQSTKTVQQKNVTTRLVWGELLSHISAEENLDRIVYLSRHINDPKQFLLEID